MKISIIVGGRFHAFNLAEELNKKEFLKQLITSYPKYYVNKHNYIHKSKVISIYLKELIQRSFLKNFFDLNDILTEYFDLRASKSLDYKNLDILIGWSSFSYRSFLKVKNEKCIKVLERGSTHIDFQNQILNEEYSIQNLKIKPISKYIIEKEKKEYELADFIMVPTDFVKQTFIDKGFKKEKIIKNPYGVNLKEFGPRETGKIKQEVFRIIYTGTISVRKGVLYLLEVFNDLKFENIELLMIGNVEKDLIKKLKKYKSNKKIVFKKSVKQSELKKFYHISDVFVTCSIEEGLSMVQLQAMSCGLPVISNINSGGEEIIDNGIDGYILPIRDKLKLKEKIIYLFNNRDLCIKMGYNAEKKAANHYSWEKYGQNAISIYQELLNK